MPRLCRVLLEDTALKDSSSKRPRLFVMRKAAITLSIQGVLAA